MLCCSTLFVLAVCLLKESLVSVWPRVVDSQRIMTQKENDPSLLNFSYPLKDASVKMTSKRALMERKAGQAELTAAAVCFFWGGRYPGEAFGVVPIV